MKLPLSYDVVDESIVDAAGKVICHFGPSGYLWAEDAAHAREIVAACNAHEKLIGALKQARNDLLIWIARGSSPIRNPTEDPTVRRIDAALAAIPKGGTP